MLVNVATAGAVLDRAPAFLLQNGYVADAEDYKGGCLTDFNPEADVCALVKFALNSDN